MGGVRIGGRAVLPVGIFAYQVEDTVAGWQRIYKVSLEPGQDPVEVTTGSVTDSDPSVSPDGTQIAFLRTVSSQFRLHIVNADGSGVAQLDSTNGARAPMWHPDGTKILYRIGGSFATIEPDGSNKTDVSPDATPPSGTFDARAPVWNSDGTKYAFLYDFTSGLVSDEVWVADADGTSATKLSDTTLGGSAGRNPAWAHGSDVIAFCERITGTDHVSIINADGTGKTQLTNTGISPAQFKYAWALDDSAIFVAQADASPWTMYDVDPAGGQAAVSPTLNGAGRVGEGIPIVAPNGRVYVVRTTTLDLVSILPDGSDLRVEHDPASADQFIEMTGNSTEV